MTTQNINTALAKELHHQIKMAAGKITGSKKPQILTWNGEKIVVTPIDGKRASTVIEQSNCLGVYDFDSTSEQILNDLLVVMEKKD